jgi:hypothetical protein
MRACGSARIAWRRWRERVSHELESSRAHRYDLPLNDARIGGTRSAVPPLLGAIFSTLLALGCSATPSEDTAAPTSDASSSTQRTDGGDATLPDGGPTDAAADLDTGPVFLDVGLPFDAAGGWELTVYYTPVETYASGDPLNVVGCAAKPCVDASDDLGTFRSGFVDEVIAQGTGKITEGTYAGGYLNWSGAVGFWLDVAPRDARGAQLEARVSAAADPRVAFGLAFRVVGCGVDYQNGAPINPVACAALQSARWVVRDRFEVGSVGAHFDLYLGEEDASDFAASPLLVSARAADVRFVP